MPDAKQKTSKLADMLASASIFKSRDGIAVVVVNPFMALLSFRGIDTPSLPAQGEQRRPSLFNIRRDNPLMTSPIVTTFPRFGSDPALPRASPRGGFASDSGPRWRGVDAAGSGQDPTFKRPGSGSAYPLLAAIRN